MLLGYVRVSSLDQNLASSLETQRNALQKTGCQKLYSDTATGTTVKLVGLEACLAAARPGDTLVVWSLDRLGSNVSQLIAIVQELTARNVGFKSLQDNLDTHSPTGKHLLHVFTALAECERCRAEERVEARVAGKRARGHNGGRKPALNAQQREVALALHRENGMSISEICRTLGVSRTTFYRSLPRHSLQPTPFQQAAPSSIDASLTVAPGPSKTRTLEMTDDAARSITVASPIPPAALSSLPTSQKQYRPENQYSKPAWLTVASSKTEYAALQLEAARRLLALGSTMRERRTFEFRQARRELEGIIPVYSSESELMDWAQREVKNAERVRSM